ncbi:phosphate ABC transporter substrate-binding protein [Velocimicrobium porci]|mgnify:CR=1 FL=1|uniref:Phosphate-binding protein n=1 Tax=Velocimicrobium porci TaxID=2606634 RepID=A0A6L5XY71_9FIRM|nr:phosphate ABC transporter substrate-binding protein [Velocimicrobium porci]MSS63614.1 phosphate ABC transporter substrate-binding protein [Velocimicrobium porci]
MKRKMKQILGMMLLGVFAATMVTGCGTSTGENSDTKTEQKTKTTDNNVTGDTGNLNGTITMIGSTSMEKFANALGEAFMEKNPGVTVSPEFVGSSAGIEALVGGTADIGNASRNLEDSEKEAGAVENIVAIDGIAIVTDEDNKVKDLKKDDLTKIYSGEITNWKELGGDDTPIVVVGREAGSGTRGAFEEILGIEDKCKYANELDSTGAVMAKVAATKGAIGYVSLDVLDDTVNALTLEGVEPTAENIKSGDYFLSRPFVMATKGEISEQNDLVKALFDYLKSEEGKQLVESVGLITVD